MGKNGMEEKAGTASAKKAAVLGAEKSNRRPLLATLVIAAALMGAGIFVYMKKSGGSEAIAAFTATDASAAEVAFPTGDFGDGQAKFFQLDGGGGVVVRYYVVKGPDGLVKTALDTCDACWAAGKGYKQAGGAMVCQNCRRSFEIVKIGEIHGGCNPVALPSRLRDGKVVIEVKDILAGRHYFDLPKKG